MYQDEIVRIINAVSHGNLMVGFLCVLSSVNFAIMCGLVVRLMEEKNNRNR